VTVDDEPATTAPAAVARPPMSNRKVGPSPANGTVNTFAGAGRYLSGSLRSPGIAARSAASPVPGPMPSSSTTPEPARTLIRRITPPLAIA